MASNEARHTWPVIDLTLPSQNEMTEGKTSIFSDTSGTVFPESQDSDDDFSALDLLLANIWTMKSKLAQNTEAAGWQSNRTSNEIFCDLDNEPSTIIHPIVPLESQMHLSDQFGSDNQKIEVGDKLPLKHHKTADIPSHKNDAGKLHLAVESNFLPEHPWLERYQGTLIDASELTDQDEGNKYSFKLCKNCKFFGVTHSVMDMNVSDSVIQRPGDSSPQRPDDPFQQPPADSFQKWPGDSFQQRPGDSFQQRPGDSFQQRPDDPSQQRPGDSFQQGSVDSSQQQPIQHESCKDSPNLLIHFAEDSVNDTLKLRSNDEVFDRSGTLSVNGRKNEAIPLGDDEHIRSKNASCELSLRKDLKCRKCPRVFTNEHLYNAHLQYHFDRNPFKCDKCVKEYPYKYQLRNHYRMHTREKPFKCEECTFATSWVWSLKGHRQRRHGK